MTTNIVPVSLSSPPILHKPEVSFSFSFSEAFISMDFSLKICNNNSLMYKKVAFNLNFLMQSVSWLVWCAQRGYDTTETPPSGQKTVETDENNCFI